MVAFGICNALLSTKGKLIKPLKEKYDRDKLVILKRMRKLKEQGSPGDTLFEFQADFETLTLPPLAIDILQSLAFEKLSLTGKPILLVTTLRQSLHTLDHALRTRNALIEGYKAQSPMPRNMLIALYFGLPYGGGHVNQDYPASLDAIADLTDSAIFFSHHLCKDLGGHGDRIAETFKKMFGSGAPTIAKPSFAKAVAADLMPSEEKFAEWTGMFVEKPGTDN